MFTKEQIKSAYKRLPDNLQEYITSPEIDGKIQKNIELFVNANNRDSADREIYYSLIALQTLETAINKIHNLGDNEEALKKLKGVLAIEVFGEIKKQLNIDLDEFVALNANSPVPAEPIVPNEDEREVVRAEDHHPMVEVGMTAHETQPGERAIYNAPISPNQTPAPKALQSIIETKLKESETTRQLPRTPHYPGGLDPYREPLD
jgi:hypothetical protein